MVVYINRANVLGNFLLCGEKRCHHKRRDGTSGYLDTFLRICTCTGELLMTETSRSGDECAA